ncbi:SDR family oxidoreductase [Nakamurella sp. YIM 132087]|uniref:SDR family oxidoreductase n=1 Tax=Nakamurella alba TaxID=2665158 RepID=A0A7K1FN90_9ACTN|nr:SDR family oxidoreductase [Nakamurella alba]MTD15631.1 SDR family oxidoreductase [Nakamurella alba]
MTDDRSAADHTGAGRDDRQLPPLPNLRPLLSLRPFEWPPPAPAPVANDVADGVHTNGHHHSEPFDDDFPEAAAPTGTDGDEIAEAAVSETTVVPETGQSPIPVAADPTVRIPADVVRAADTPSAATAGRRHRRRRTDDDTPERFSATRSSHHRADPAHGGRALIIGGSGAVGSLIAAGLADDGFRVAVHHGQRADRAREISRALSGRGHLAVGADLTDPDAVERMFDAVDQHFDGIDVVVHAAGTPRSTDIGAASAAWGEAWATALSVELLGAALVAQAAARSFAGRGQGGRLVLLADQGRAGTGVAMDRALSQGIAGLGAGLAVELQGQGIRVAVLSSGPSAGSDGWDPAEVASLVCRISSGPPGGPSGAVVTID